MEDAWLSYRQAAEKLGVSRQAVRLRAIRGRWPRTKGNDGEARIRIPETVSPVRTPPVQALDVSLVDALREHVATLKADIERLEALLAVERERAEKQAAAIGVDLAHERERADAAISAFASLAERLDALAASAARPWWRRLMR